MPKKLAQIEAETRRKLAKGAKKQLSKLPQDHPRYDVLQSKVQQGKTLSKPKIRPQSSTTQKTTLQNEISHFPSIKTTTQDKRLELMKDISPSYNPPPNPKLPNITRSLSKMGKEERLKMTDAELKEAINNLKNERDETRRDVLRKEIDVLLKRQQRLERLDTEFWNGLVENVSGLKINVPRVKNTLQQGHQKGANTWGKATDINEKYENTRPLFQHQGVNLSHGDEVSAFMKSPAGQGITHVANATSNPFDYGINLLTSVIS